MKNFLSNYCKIANETSGADSAGNITVSSDGCSSEATGNKRFRLASAHILESFGGFNTGHDIDGIQHR